MERSLRWARFSYIEILEQFVLSFQPSTDCKPVLELPRLASSSGAITWLLLGPPGTSQTTSAVALGITAIEPTIGCCSYPGDLIPGCDDNAPAAA